jgi:glycosyltransferase involved in cell wall biosynthesis
MRLLHCLSQIPGKPGSGVYLQAIVREAARAGHQQAAVCGLPHSLPPSETGLVPPAEKIFPVFFETPQLPFPVAGMSDVMPYPSTRFSDFNDRMLAEYETAFTTVLEKAVAEFQPELIHTHHLWLMTGLARSLFPQLPIVTSVHGTELRQLELVPKKLRRRVVERVAGVDRVLALNPKQREEIIATFGFAPERVSVVGTGYRRDLFCAACCSKDPVPTIIYAGKLSRAKGVPWLLEAFARLPGDLRLILAGSGDGPEAEAIRRQAAEDSRIELAGMVSQEKLAELFKASHIMVLPSFFEGVPLVLLEALACDCRVVATDLPGIRELLGDAPLQEGFVELVPCPPLTGPDRPRPEGEEPFRRALTRALANQLEKVRHQQFICSQPLEQVLLSSTWPEVFNRIAEIYQNTLVCD